MGVQEAVFHVVVKGYSLLYLHDIQSSRTCGFSPVSWQRRKESLGKTLLFHAVKFFFFPGECYHLTGTFRKAILVDIWLSLPQVVLLPPSAEIFMDRGLFTQLPYV